MTKVKWLEKWEKYWRLTVLWEFERRQVGKKWTYHRYEKCECDCWKIVRVDKWNLKRWHTKSCWCLWAENIQNNINRARKHWKHWERIYRIYYDIKGRCENKNNDRYYRYWARGIKCKWNTFEDFYRDMWDDYYKHVEEYWENDTTIDRINNDWDYCKENCRRSTKKEQWRNTSRNRLFDREGEKLTIWEIVERSWTDICYDTVVYRVYVCWRNITDAVYKPLVHKRTNFNFIKS